MRELGVIKAAEVGVTFTTNWTFRNDLSNSLTKNPTFQPFSNLIIKNAKSSILAGSTLDVLLLYGE